MHSHSVVFLTSFFDRAIGLLKKRPDNCILVLSPCSSIHTFFMRNCIDVAFVSKEGKVLLAEKGLEPGKTKACRNAHVVLERLSKKEEQWFKEGDNVLLIR